MSSVNMQTRRWCGQDHTTVSVESSTLSDRRQRRPDVRRNSIRRYDGKTSWWLAAERRCCLDAVAETGTQWAAKYWGAVPFTHRRV